MKSNLKKHDLAKDRYNSFSLEDVVRNNLSLQSIERTLTNDYKISIGNINANYFLSDQFKTKFSSYSMEDKTKLCRLLGSLRHKELLKKLEE